jgi:phage terminase Nu1 subunit (DNA packaging protein)
MTHANVEQVAKALNLTARRVQQLVKLGMPQAARGQYELGACMHWYIRHLQKAVEARSSGDGNNMTSLVTERTKQAREQAERMQMANLKARGEVLVTADVRQQVLGAIAFLAQDLAAVPQRVMTDEATKAKIEDEVTIAQNRFAEHLAGLVGQRPRVARGRRKHPGTSAPLTGRVGGRLSDSATGESGAGSVAE